MFSYMFSGDGLLHLGPSWSIYLVIFMSHYFLGCEPTTQESRPTIAIIISGSMY